MKPIRLADGLDVPIDVVTQTLATIGRKGAGKTYLATSIAEQMLDRHAQVLAKLQPARQRILRVLIHAYPNVVSRDDLARAAEASATSSAFANNLGALRSLGLVQYGGRNVVASELLWLR